MEELIKKIVSYRDKAKWATGDERVEFAMLNEHFIVELIRGLPFLLCPDSKLKCDIIIWHEDTEDISPDGTDDRSPT